MARIKKQDIGALPWWTYETKEEDSRESLEKHHKFMELVEDIKFSEMNELTGR